MPSPLEILMKKVDTLQTLIMRSKNEIIHWDTSTVSITELKLQLTDLEEHKKKLTVLYEEVSNLSTPVEFAREEPQFNTLLSAVRNMLVQVGELLCTKEAAAKAKVQPSIKLERIKIPQFTGEVSMWQSFHDLFVSSIDKNPTLSGVEKMIHLKSSLGGEAAAIVSSFPATDANYKQAWDMVIKRYSNKREIIFSHIRKFVELKPNTEESALGLRTVTDTINECVRSLANVAVPVEHWDLIIIYLALKKLTIETRKQWLLEEKDSIPTLKKFIDYLEARARALADSENSTSKSKASSSTFKKKSSSHASTFASNISCLKCSEPHHLHQCKIFSNSSYIDRKEFVERKQLCFNCLFAGHSVAKCRMQFSCKKCGKKHHSMLHKDSVVPTATSPVSHHSDITENIEEGSPHSVTSSHSESHARKQNLVLMGTFMVAVKDSHGVTQKCRVFLDPGSESNFITEFCVDRLGLRRSKTCVQVSGISGSKGETATGIVEIKLCSVIHNFQLSITALILRKITNKLPTSQCQESWSHLKGLELADPSFNAPGHIDILLGAGDAASIMIPGILKGPSGTPSAQNTQFGWVISGTVHQSLSSFHIQVEANHSRCSINDTCLDSAMTKFWELEELNGNQETTSVEDETCEQHFVQTHQRNSSGRYTVNLPFRTPIQPLGHSRNLALNRFYRVEKRLQNQPLIKQNYIECMREAIDSKFMEPVPEEEIDKSHEESYYMPHREVLKPLSSSTKVRIVYDASAKTSNGVSLNDTLITGPKLQVDLVPLLIRFRSYKIAMSADITKFYTQYEVATNHVDFQRLVWREDSSHPIQDFRMLRVTFGVTSAPFLAIRCLHQLANDQEIQYPEAARVLKEEFLVDNLLSGTNDVESALNLQQQILQIMKSGDLNLTKWSSNCREVLQAIPLGDRECKFPLTIQDDNDLKTVGLLWNPEADLFGISINIPIMSTTITKRKVLSAIAKTFDPLGWLSPVTVRLKILMQMLWKAQLDWDAPLPNNLCKSWIEYCEDLTPLETFRIQRCIVCLSVESSSAQYELHGFSDASIAAYAACVYLKTVGTGEGSVSLVIAKTKVSPLKTETIPRLELCAAVLLAKLMKLVQKSMVTEFQVIRCWTDSTIVLDWLKSDKKLPIFVANRVRIIQDLIPCNNWHHVSGDQNPADAPSRGISSEKLFASSLWLSGPSWLLTSSYEPNTTIKNTYSATTSDLGLLEFINKSSSYSTMKRVVAYCHRFGRNCRLPRSERIVGNLSTVELKSALTTIVSTIQRESFPDEIRSCESNRAIKSSIKFLTPFMDSSGLLRVGGRLSNSSLRHDQQHPLLLPKNHPFTDAVVRYYHNTHLHAGPQLLLSLVRDQFWIIRGPDVVKRIVKRCIVCHRQNPDTINQVMGQLPFPRVNESKPFSKTGMDYAGPFTLCAVPGRNPKLIKHYVCVFVCMATKAIHLELAGDLSTPSFIGALTRFVSRRGLPTDVYCDGGKNFIGARNEMLAFVKFIKSQPHQTIVHEYLSQKDIRYHFNPPLAPHQGGLWEAGVKSMKKHLKRVIEHRHLSIEEFLTLLYQIEACLNSRPITPMSSDPNDFRALTPGHFLMGESPLALPQHNISDLNTNRLSRWQVVQQMFQHFWRRWNGEYLNTLQSRPKWFTPQPNLEVGVLVLIRDDEPTWGLLKWKLGRIVAVYPGSDGKVRTCDIKTAAGPIYRRPIVKLSPLPIYY